MNCISTFSLILWCQCQNIHLGASGKDKWQAHATVESYQQPNPAAVGGDGLQLRQEVVCVWAIARWHLGKPKSRRLRDRRTEPGLWSQVRSEVGGLRCGVGSEGEEKQTLWDLGPVKQLGA